MGKRAAGSSQPKPNSPTKAEITVAWRVMGVTPFASFTNVVHQSRQSMRNLDASSLPRSILKLKPYQCFGGGRFSRQCSHESGAFNVWWWRLKLRRGRQETWCTSWSLRLWQEAPHGQHPQRWRQNMQSVQWLKSLPERPPWRLLQSWYPRVWRHQRRHQQGVWSSSSSWPVQLSQIKVYWSAVCIAYTLWACRFW